VDGADARPCVEKISAWSAARAVREDVIVFCHGGPIAMPEDAACVLDRTGLCHGFHGASSMERLPTEIAIREQIERFGRIRPGKPASG
jgi:predicted TIM-barrel enzyme